MKSRDDKKRVLAIGEAISTPQARVRIQELANLVPGQTAIYDMEGMTSNAAKAIETLVNTIRKVQNKKGRVRVTYNRREVRVKCRKW